MAVNLRHQLFAAETTAGLPGRLQSQDIARMALLLAADDSGMIIAHNFVVDAGWA